MRNNTITRVGAVATALGALAFAPSAAGGSTAQSCPQGGASGCEPIGARPGDSRPGDGRTQSARLQLLVRVGRYGEPMWCFRNHCAY